MNLVTLTPYYKVIADAQSRALDGTCYVSRGCAPTANGTGLRVDVSAGDSVEGGVLHDNYAGGNVTLSAAPATPKYRRDIVYRDSTGTLTVGTGTSALLTSTTPVPPALPANATLLAVCFVAYGQTTLVATDVEDCRQISRDSGDGLNVLVFGALADSVTDNSAAIQAAVDALPPTGGTILIPGSSGYFSFATPIDCSGKSAIRFLGVGGPSGGSATASRMVYTGTGANAFNCQSSAGITFHNLYLQANNASFSGKVIDYRGLLGSDSAYGLVDNCIIAASGTGEGIALDKAIFMTIRSTNIVNGAYGVSGHDNGGYSNAITLQGVTFRNYTAAAMRDWGQGWNIDGCWFEPGAGGIGTIVHVYTQGASNGVKLTGCWIGDNGAVGNTQCTFTGNGFFAAGNYWGGNAGTTTALTVTSSSVGIAIIGNEITGHLNGINFSGACTGVTIVGNSWASVTNKTSGTTPSQSLIQTGATTRNIWISAHQFIVRDGTPALATQGSGTRYVAWAFDAAGVERVTADPIIVPSDYSTGSLVVKLYWTNLGVGAGDVAWVVYLNKHSDTGDMNSTTGEVQDAVTATAPAQNVLKVSTLTGNALTPAAGDALTVLIERTATAVGDTLANDAGVIGLLLEYTAKY